MANNSWQNVKYIYDLPYFARKDICRVLDQMEMWEDLAGTYMEFDMMMIQDLRREERRGASPTDELLTLWGHKNHTVLELFALLSKMQHYQAMLILKPFVPPDYHRLIENGEERLPPLPEDLKGDSGEGHGAAAADVKDMDVGSHNLNNSETNNMLQSKVHFPATQQPEIKILNTTGHSAAQENKENLSPRCNGAISPVPRDNTLGLPAENRDVNNQRRVSNVSDISSLAENHGSVPFIEYQELLVSTNNWSKHNILGKGGFGTVFKGEWKNTQVAVKRIDQRGEESAASNQVQLEQSLRELHVLNSFRHDNILPLYGYSLGGGEPCLVYQFMCNGSLEDRLLCRQGTEPLSWIQRHNIAKGTARGLQFLHTSAKRFIHGDIKSANILLDMNFIPRIGDFGLAREGPQNNYTHLTVSRVHGTRPYLPVEFLRGRQISTKVDTYSFGIVLFELGTGLRAYEDSRKYKLLKEHVEDCGVDNWEKLMDSRIAKDSAVFQHLMHLGKKCVNKLPKNRPEMEVVLKELEQPLQYYSPRGPNSLQVSVPPVSVPQMIHSPNLTPVYHQQLSTPPFMQGSNNTNHTPAFPSHSPSSYPPAQVLEVVPPPCNAFLPASLQNESFQDVQSSGSSSAGEAAAVVETTQTTQCSMNGTIHSSFQIELPNLSILGIAGESPRTSSAKDESSHSSSSRDESSRLCSTQGKVPFFCTAQGKKLNL